MPIKRTTPQGDQYSPFYLLHFTFWTRRSFFGTAVVELYMLGETQRRKGVKESKCEAFHHACRVPPLQCHRSYTASNKIEWNKQKGEYWFPCEHT